MKLKQVLNVLSSIHFITLLTSALSLIFIASSLKKTSAHIGQTIESVRAAEEIRISLLGHSKEWFLYRMTKDAIHLQAQQARIEEISLWLDEANRHIQAGHNEKELVERLRGKVKNYFVTIEELDLSETLPLDAYMLVGQSLESAAEEAKGLTSINMRQAGELETRAENENRIANALGIFYVVICMLTFPTMWYFFRNWIYKPIRNLHASLTAFNGKDFEIAEIKEGVQEIQLMSGAFRDMVQRLGEQKSNQLRFLAGVAHDLRNPLGAIKLSAEILNMDEMPTSDRKRILSIISNQVSLLDRMVGDLLESSRVEAGHLELKKSPYDVRDIVKEAVSLHESSSKIHQISFVAEGPMTCDCDPLRINQVMHNLMSNAIKYSPHGGTIKVAIRKEEGFARVTIQDQGIGIDAEDQHKIFEPFRRTKATKQTIPGVGLGLSVAKKIVEAHGGKVELSSAPGKGSTFAIKLPLFLPKSSPATVDSPHRL